MGRQEEIRKCHSLPYTSIVVLVCVAFSFVGQLVSVCVPRWWKVETVVGNMTETAYFGIWVTVDCLDDVCTQQQSNSNGDKAWIEGVKVIEVIAVLFLLASTILAAMAIYYRRKEEKHLLVWKLFTSFSGAAGIIIVMGVLIFFKKKRGLSPSQAIATKDGHADGALIISSISGVLSIVSAILIGCKILMKDTDEDDTIDYQQYITKQNELTDNKLKQKDKY